MQRSLLDMSQSEGGFVPKEAMSRSFEMLGYSKTLKPSIFNQEAIPNL